MDKSGRHCLRRSLANPAEQPGDDKEGRTRPGTEHSTSSPPTPASPLLHTPAESRNRQDPPLFQAQAHLNRNRGDCETRLSGCNSKTFPLPHPGHTRPAWRSENKGGSGRKSGQNAGGGIEGRPSADVVPGAPVERLRYPGRRGRARRPADRRRAVAETGSAAPPRSPPAGKSRHTARGRLYPAVSGPVSTDTLVMPSA